jgi:hypothetical protein
MSGAVLAPDRAAFVADLIEAQENPMLSRRPCALVLLLTTLGGCSGGDDSTAADAAANDVSAPDTSSRADATSLPDSAPGPDAGDATASADASDASDATVVTDARDGGTGIDASDGATATDGSDAATPIDASDAATPVDASDAATPVDASDAATPPTTFTLPTAGVCSVGGWCWKNPLPIAAPLKAIWGTSPTDVWATGVMGLVMHYDGNTWNGLFNIPGVGAISSIQGSGPSDVWMWDGNKMLVHWDGAKLSLLPIQSSYATSSVWGMGQEVWTAGQTGTIRHYDGSTWSTQPSGTISGLSGIFGTATNDIYVGASDGALLHYDGASWSPATIPAPPGGVTKLRVIPGITGLWALTNSGLHHYTGTSWATLVTDATGVDFWALSENDGLVVTQTQDVHFSAGHATGFPQPCMDQGVWGAPAFGYLTASDFPRSPGRDCFITKFDPGFNTTSTMMTDSLGTTGAASLAVTGTSDVWLEQGSAVLHGDGTTWTKSTTSLPVTSILVAASPTDVWALGTGGVVDHLTGGSWTPSSIGQNVDFTFGQATAPNDVWALAGGHAWHWDGASWSDKGAVATNNGLPGIWGSGPNLAYAVGGSAIDQWNGASWSPVFSTASPAAADTVWGASPSDVWASSDGFVFHYDGHAWATLSNGFGFAMSHQVAYAWGAANDMWSLGDTGVAHWNGSAWTYEQLGYSMPSFRNIRALGGEDWILGTTAGGLNALLRHGP